MKERYTGKREDLGPGKRKRLTQLIDIEVSKGEARLGIEFWKRLRKDTSVSIHNLKSLITAEGRQLTEKKLQVRRRGKGRYWRQVLQYRSQGKREMTGEKIGGLLKEEKETLRVWSKKEMDLGHELGGDDLLDQYQLEIEDLIFYLEKEVKEWDALSDEEAREQSVKMSEKTQKLQAAKSFLERGLSRKQTKAYHKQQLLQFCEVVERKPDLVFPITEET